MTIVVSNKTRIHFQYEGEKGAFLILHHGLFGSHKDWFDAGYVEELSKDFRVIIPDARGHGRSERHSQKERFRFALFAEDMVAIMDWLDVRNAHFVGYSLGALVGFDLLYRFPDRVRLVMVGGEAPFVTEPAQADWREQADQLRGKPFSQLVDERCKAGRLVRSSSTVDEEEHGVAVALLEAMSGWEAPSREKLPVQSPITLFAGENDPAADRIAAAARRIPRARFQSFPGLSHLGTFQDKSGLMGALHRFIRTPRRPTDQSHRAQSPTPGATVSQERSDELRAVEASSNENSSAKDDGDTTTAGEAAGSEQSLTEQSIDTAHEPSEGGGGQGPDSDRPGVAGPSATVPDDPASNGQSSHGDQDSSDENFKS